MFPAHLLVLRRRRKANARRTDKFAPNAKSANHFIIFVPTSMTASSLAARCLLLHHALAVSGFPPSVHGRIHHNAHVQRWLRRPLPSAAGRRRPRCAVSGANDDEFDGSSGRVVEGVSVEPNLLTGAEIDLPSNIDIDSISIRGGASTADSSSNSATSTTTATATASKRSMMAFALPALGIFLVNPLLSNIDNAFVGRTVGSVGLGK